MASKEKKKVAVLGFRCWSISSGKLQAAAAGTIWNPGLNVAYCHEDEHIPPGKNCDCGFNSFYTLPKEKHIKRTNPGYVWGAIAGAGKARKHELGTRTHQAIPIALYAPKAQGNSKKRRKDWRKQLNKIAKKYSIPVFKDRQDFLTFCARYATQEDTKKPSRSDVNRSVGGNVISEKKSNRSSYPSTTRSRSYSYSSIHQPQILNRTPVKKSKFPDFWAALMTVAVAWIIGAFVIVFIVNSGEDTSSPSEKKNSVEKQVNSALSNSVINSYKRKH